MKQQPNRLKCVAIAALTIGLALGAGAENVAEVTIGGTTTEYSTVGDAWSACDGKDATLKLLRDASISSELSKTTANTLLLDLNGHMLKRTGGGRVIAFPGNGNGDNLTIRNGVLTTDGATVPGNGGCICLRNYASLSLYDVTITNCAASGDGGAIFSGTNSVLLLDGCTLRYNQAAGKGGAICVPGGPTLTNLMDKCLLRNTVITDNRAVAGGAGVHFKRAERPTYTIKYTTAMGTLVTESQTCYVGEMWTAASAPTGVTDYNFTGWAGVYAEGQSYESLASNADDTVVLEASWVKIVEPPCLASGTLVAMADGSVKTIENVKEGDVVRTFDHEGGTNSTARVYYAFKGASKATPFVLEFEGECGAAGVCALQIAGCHDLLEQCSRKYVTITAANAGQYIGAKFYGADCAWHTLTNVTMGTEAVEYYSLYTAQHQNVYAGGMLTVCDDADYLLNIYELDDNLKADADQLAADIAQYGITTFEEAETYGMSREWYDDASAKYLHIAMGKQLVSREYVERLFASTGKATAKPMMATMPMMAMASSSATLSADDVSVGVLTLGEGVIVTNNFVGKTESNILLWANDADDDSRSVIQLAEQHDGIRAGVAVMLNGTTPIGGRFTFNVTSGDAALFSSDSLAFSVLHSPENACLVFVEGIEVGENVWAHLKDGDCTIRGTGDMRSYPATGISPLTYRSSEITNLVIESGVTSVGTRFFENMWYLQNVRLGADVTNVSARAFKKCYGLTNVTSVASGDLTVGDYAFAGCHALQVLDFGEEGKPEFGEGAYTFKTAIYMRDGVPNVYTIPELTMGNYDMVKQGSNDLVNWVEVSEETQKDYHFFRIILEPKK